jgi:hypothetical protein
MFYLARAKVVQERPPTVVLFQVFGHMFGDEDVTGITTIHHPLGHVDSGTGDVLALVHIDHFVNRTVVNSHPQRDPRMFFQGSRNFYGALRRRFGICAENKRHPIARREPDQFSFGLGFAKFVRAANDFIELAQQSALLVNEQFRVAYDVDEQDVADLQTGLFLGRWHETAYYNMTCNLTSRISSLHTRKHLVNVASLQLGEESYAYSPARQNTTKRTP